MTSKRVVRPPQDKTRLKARLELVERDTDKHTPREQLEQFRQPGFAPRNYAEEVSAISNALRTHTKQEVSQESHEHIMWAVSEYRRNAEVDEKIKLATKAFRASHLKQAVSIFQNALLDKNAYSWAVMQRLRAQGFADEEFIRFTTAVIDACEHVKRTGISKAKRTANPAVDRAVFHLIGAWNGSALAPFKPSSNNTPDMAFLQNAFVVLQAKIAWTRINTAVQKFRRAVPVK